jgi:hypothetical protein
MIAAGGTITETFAKLVAGRLRPLPPNRLSPRKLQYAAGNFIY